jgi:DNA-binding response OmpR family regulator
MKKVLIISDDNQLLEGLKNALFSHEFTLQALPGREGIVNELAVFKPDMVLIDFLLKDINGGSLCHQVRVHPELGNLPVILLSEYPDIERFTAKFGCNAVLRKPVMADELIDSLAILLEHPGLAPNYFYQAS